MKHYHFPEHSVIVKSADYMDKIKQIKAQQQEITGWQQRYSELDAGHSKLFKDFCGMKQENQQLQEQVIQAAKGSVCIVGLALDNVRQDAEIQQLKTTNDEFIRQILKNINTIEQLKQERDSQQRLAIKTMEQVEQLQAQNGALREAFETLIKSLESYGSHDNLISPWSLISQARQAITTSTTYHNPADVEALAKAKYYLTEFAQQEDCCSDTCACETEYEVLQCAVGKALAEIKKGVGE